jgi:Ca-activated chloride channel family protein
MKPAASRCLALMITAVLAACTMPRDVPRETSSTESNSADVLADRASTSQPKVETPPPHATAAPRERDQEAGAVAASANEASKRKDDTLDEAVIVSGSYVKGAAQDAAVAVDKVSGEAPQAPSSTIRQERRMAYFSGPHPEPAPPVYQQPTDTEKYQHQDDNPVRLVSEQPFSTFSIDVDTGAYSNVRRFLNAGRLPPQDAVRVEELINYFDYQYEPPRSRAQPFRVATELAPAPWNPEALLLRIGIKGFEISAEQRPAANLVFLVDVSGSMQSPDKLPLLKNSLRLLTEQLSARDRVSMVVYAGNSGVVLEPTPGDQKSKIHAAIDQLEAGGSTNGADGIRRAYQLAHEAESKGGINRVILATDGDFNVGIVSFEALVDMAEQQRETGVALTTLGFGTGNYNDQLLERLADAGNGNYAYVDTLAEARKVLVSELSATLLTIAKDVKIQVEFNPAEVLEYRLIGYENRGLAREDFNNDKVDAGEIGAGHRVTALYEIVKAGGQGLLDPPRYGAAATQRRASKGGELAHLRLRYKEPDGKDSKLIEIPIMASSVLPVRQTSADFRFAASVAAFGQMLRGGKYTGKFGYEDVTALAKDSLAEDGEGYRREFVSLVELAQALTPVQKANEERVGDLAR